MKKKNEIIKFSLEQIFLDHADRAFKQGLYLGIIIGGTISFIILFLTIVLR